MCSIKSVSEGGREADNNHGEGELICKMTLMKAMLKTKHWKKKLWILGG